AAAHGRGSRARLRGRRRVPAGHGPDAAVGAVQAGRVHARRRLGAAAQGPRDVGAARHRMGDAAVHARCVDHDPAARHERGGGMSTEGALVIVTPPATGPVTYDLAKLHCHVDHDEEQSLIEGYILAAAERAERWIRRAMIARTLE